MANVYEGGKLVEPAASTAKDPVLGEESAELEDAVREELRIRPYADYFGGLKGPEAREQLSYIIETLNPDKDLDHEGVLERIKRIDWKLGGQTDESKLLRIYQYCKSIKITQSMMLGGL